MNKRMIAWLLVAMSMTSTTVYATTSKVDVLETVSSPKEETSQTTKEKEKKVLMLDEAIEKGLTNSLILQQVKNQGD